MSDKKKKVEVVGDPKAGTEKTKISIDTYKKAKSKKGVLSDRPDYKGKVIKDSEGNVASVKLHGGTIIKPTGVVSRAKALMSYEKDKKLYNKKVADFYKTRERLSTLKK